MIAIDEAKDFVGWKAIADYLGVSTATAQRYRRHHKLPAHRVVGHIRATEEDLKAWLARFKRS